MFGNESVHLTNLDHQSRTPLFIGKTSSKQESAGFVPFSHKADTTNNSHRDLMNSSAHRIEAADTL